jgi:hypothetical protein
LGGDQEVDGSLDFGSFGGGHVARIWPALRDAEL